MSLLTKLDAIVAHGKHVPSEAYRTAIDKALNDNNHYVRAAAIQHPNATKENIDKALNDEIDVVRAAAVRQKQLRGL